MGFPKRSDGLQVRWTSRTNTDRRKIFYKVGADEQFEQEKSIDCESLNAAKACRCVSLLSEEKSILVSTKNLVIEEEADMIFRELKLPSAPGTSRKDDRKHKRKQLKETLPQRGLDAVMFQLERHILRLQEAPHPHAINYLGVGKNWTREAGLDVFVVCEDTNGTSLEEFLQTGAMGASQLVNFLQCMTSALAGRHARNIAHTHIQPSCVMMDARGQWKLAGWEDAALSEAKKALLANAEPILESNDGSERDLWCLGWLALCALTGRVVEKKACPHALESLQKKQEHPSLVWVAACFRGEMSARELLSHSFLSTVSPVIAE